jgi:hypothetical protein
MRPMRIDAIVCQSLVERERVVSRVVDVCTRVVDVCTGGVGNMLFKSPGALQISYKENENCTLQSSCALFGFHWW